MTSRLEAKCRLTCELFRIYRGIPPFHAKSTADLRGAEGSWSEDDFAPIREIAVSVRIFSRLEGYFSIPREVYL